MKICLINPPSNYSLEVGEEWCDNSLCNSSYLGLRYLEAALLNSGVEVDIYDCPYEQIDLKTLKDILLEKNYNYVGISSFYYNLFNVQRIIMFLECMQEKSFVFLGGYAVTLDAEEILRKNRFVKAAFIAEGEKTIVEFFYNIKNGVDWHQTKGIAYIEGDEYIYNEHIGETNLDTLPFPKHFVSERSNMVSILASRGCYGNCSFCSEKQFYIRNGTKVSRYRSVDNVIKELAEIKLNEKVKYISFADSNFMPGSQEKHRWLKELIDKLKYNNIRFTYRVNTRANDIVTHKNLLLELKKVGFLHYFIGIESFSQVQLDFYQKYTTVEQNITALRILADNNLKFEIGFLPFEPYATMAEIRESIENLWKLDLFDYFDYTQEFFSLSSKLFLTKGTMIYELVKKDNLFMPNDIGYRFINSDVQEYYERVELWKEEVKPYVKLKYWIDKAQFHSLHDEKNKMEKCYTRLLKIDLSIMKELLNLDESSHEIIEKGKEMIEWEIKNHSKLFEFIIKY